MQVGGRRVEGVGGDLAHYAQDNGSEPQIPLGSVGTLAFGRRPALPWQVVGYVERCTVPGGSDDDDDSQEFWREYLLYHRTEGFAFIVDAQDGWSWTAPITGVPEAVGDGVRHEGVLLPQALRLHRQGDATCSASSTGS